MKTLRSIFAVLAISLAPFSIAHAHDSFSFGLNLGGFGPPPVYYSPPPVVYYGGAPTVYYRSAPAYYYEPRASFRYYDNGYRRWGHDRDWRRDHDGRGWGRGDWDRGGHRHGRD